MDNEAEFLRLLLDGERELIESQYIRPSDDNGPSQMPYTFRCVCGATDKRIAKLQHNPRCRYVARMAEVARVEDWLDSVAPKPEQQHPDDVDPLRDEWMHDPAEGDR